MRYFIEIAYNGKNYFGWQVQPEVISVQEVLDTTISTLLRKEIKIAGAGRTDAGVHARQMFAHFDFEEIKDFDRFLFRVNSFLPKDISVKNIFEVHEDAHTRFDASSRTYEYVITLLKDPFLTDGAYLIHQKPDISLMNDAANILLNHKDFQCFSRSNTDVKTYYCSINKAYWKEENDQLIFTISADRFLRNMVRAIVGTLLNVGFGKTSLQQFEEIIESKERSKAGASAPAHGLFLTEIKYPKTIYK